MADGSVKHLHALGRPVLNESGELNEYIGTVIDVTEPKRGEGCHAEAADRSRACHADDDDGRTGGSIAHEINQPLGALVNNSNVAMRLAKAADDYSRSSC